MSVWNANILKLGFNYETYTYCCSTKRAEITAGQRRIEVLPTFFLLLLWRRFERDVQPFQFTIKHVEFDTNGQNSYSSSWILDTMPEASRMPNPQWKLTSPGSKVRIFTVSAVQGNKVKILRSRYTSPWNRSTIGSSNEMIEEASNHRLVPPCAHDRHSVPALQTCHSSPCFHNACVFQM